MFKPPQAIQKTVKAALEKASAKDTSIHILALSKMLLDGTSLSPADVQKGSLLLKASPEPLELLGGASGGVWFDHCQAEAQKSQAKASSDNKRNELLYKDELLDIKDVDESEGIVTGYFAHFNNKDSVGDIIKQGAFLETISDWGPQGKNRIKVLWNHNPSDLIGIPKLLKEDEAGLYHESKITKNVRGLEILKLIADGVITEHSIGYTTLGYEFDEEDFSVMYLTKIRLYEGSFVTWGVNEMTPVTGMKSALLPMSLLKSETDPLKICLGLKDLIERAEKSLRKGTWHTDDVPAMVELTFKTMRPIVDRLGATLQETKNSSSNLEEAMLEQNQVSSELTPASGPESEDSKEEFADAEAVAELRASLTKELDLSDPMVSKTPERSQEEVRQEKMLEGLSNSFDFDFSNL